MGLLSANTKLSVCVIVASGYHGACDSLAFPVNPALENMLFYGPTGVRTLVGAGVGGAKGTFFFFLCGAVTGAVVSDRPADIGKGIITGGAMGGTGGAVLGGAKGFARGALESLAGYWGMYGLAHVAERAYDFFT